MQRECQLISQPGSEPDIRLSANAGRKQGGELPYWLSGASRYRRTT